MIELCLAAGPLVWVVLVGALAGLGLAVERLWAVLRADVDTDRVLLDIFESLREGGVAEAVTHCERDPAPVTMVLRAGLKRLGDGPIAVQTAMQSAEERETHRLEGGTSALFALAVALPLVGAGGTLIEVLRVLAELGRRDATKLAAWITSAATLLSPAVLPAALGLLAGAVIFLGERAVSARTTKLRREMRRASRDLELHIMAKPAA